MIAQFNFQPEVVFLLGGKYRKIPGYPMAYAGENGEIFFIRSDGSVKRAVPFEWKTSKGTYLYVKIVNDDFFQVTKAVHQLVCLTYHGEPPKDTRIYEPNHKNTNKHDNRPENLEWMTRADNVQHIYDSGTCLQGYRVKVTDLETKEVKEYYSLSSVARVFGVPRHQMKDLIMRHRDKPYQGKFVFILDDSNEKKVQRNQSRSIAFKNYITGEITICSSFENAGTISEVAAGTIRSRLGIKYKGDKDALLSCFVFRDLSDKTPWPEYSVEAAQKSKEKFITK